MALMGVSYGFSSTLFGALWPELYGTNHLGGIRSLIVAFMVFATAMGPGLTGALIDAGVSYPGQIAAMGVYCVMMIGVMTIVSRRALLRRPRAIQRGAEVVVSSAVRPIGRIKVALTL